MTLILYEEGQRGHPKMLAYGTHPILAHAFRTKPLEELIEYVKSRPQVWIATRGARLARGRDPSHVVWRACPSKSLERALS